MQPLQIHTKSSLGDVAWVLEKTSGTLRVRNEISYEDGAKKEFYKALNYTGALISVEIDDYIIIRSLSNFGVLYHPEVVAWSDIEEKSENIYALFFQETAGVAIDWDYNKKLIPFVGYSYLKLDYTDHYSFLPSGFLGHKVYHNYLFGLEEDFIVNRWLKFSLKGIITPLAYYYPLNNSKALCTELGAESFLDFQDFGIHLYISNRRTREYGSAYKEYFSSISDFGFTFRLGSKFTED